MATKLTTAVAVRVILDGGDISELCPAVGKIRKYKVHKRNDLYGISDHITPKQFEELIGAGVIEYTQDRTDKYGNIINFYELRKEYKK